MPAGSGHPHAPIWMSRSRRADHRCVCRARLAAIHLGHLLPTGAVTTPPAPAVHQNGELIAPQFHKPNMALPRIIIFTMPGFAPSTPPVSNLVMM